MLDPAKMILIVLGKRDSKNNSQVLVSPLSSLCQEKLLAPTIIEMKASIRQRIPKNFVCFIYQLFPLSLKFTLN